MEENQIARMKSAFEEAYGLRFKDEDIDWKPTRYKDKRTGQFVEGKPLAYLNWAVAWRSMLQVYPDAEFGVDETAEGSPLWDVNGHGMVKCWVSAFGIRRTEVFPIMQGGQNDSMKLEEIDGRDVNDSIQRGLTKAIARWGVGLYIYEGKCEAKQACRSNYPSRPQTAPSAPQNAPRMGEEPLTPTAYAYLAAEMAKKGVTKASLPVRFGVAYETMNRAQYSKVVAGLKELPDAQEGPSDDDMPF